MSNYEHTFLLNLVTIIPGDTPFTRMFISPHSGAKAFVIPSSAVLLIPYGPICWMKYTKRRDLN